MSSFLKCAMHIACSTFAFDTILQETARTAPSKNVHAVRVQGGSEAKKADEISDVVVTQECAMDDNVGVISIAKRPLSESTLSTCDGAASTSSNEDPREDTVKDKITVARLLRAPKTALQAPDRTKQAQ